jgi:hypothetical protein
MPKYIDIRLFCPAETMSETIASIIDDQRKVGYTFCDDQTEEDAGYCFLCLIFKKEEVEEAVQRLN